MTVIMRGISAGFTMAMFYAFIKALEQGDYWQATAFLCVCWLNAGNFRTLTLRLQASEN